MITAAVFLFVLSLARVLWRLPDAKAAPGDIELRIEITANAVAACTCALVLLWGWFFGLLGLP